MITIYTTSTSYCIGNVALHSKIFISDTAYLLVTIMLYQSTEPGALGKASLYLLVHVIISKLVIDGLTGYC